MPERLNVQAEREAARASRYVVFAHNLVGTGGWRLQQSGGCSEKGGDDGVVTLGCFNTTTVNGVSHQRGTYG